MDKLKHPIIGHPARPTAIFSSVVGFLSMTGTLCALDSCSGPVLTPSGLGVCRQLGPRVFPDGRCCRWAGGRGVPASANRWSRRSGFPGLWCSIRAGTGCFGAVPFALGSARQGEGELESSSFHPLRRGLIWFHVPGDSMRFPEKRRQSAAGFPPV